jgi:NAD(P)-dependent dehydrogenase (short-subunit alcohol dehydrogenase family)
MSMEFEGRVAVVTGGARGIGLAVAQELSAQGANVAILDVREDDLNSCRRYFADCPGRLVTTICDVTSAQSVDSAFRSIRDELGDVNILINNAGIIKFESITEMSLESYHATMNVNTLGVFLCTKAVIPQMQIARWGKIVTIGSSAGKTGGSMPVGVYGASKAAVMVMMKSLARELAEYNINVNAVAPALIATDMIRGLDKFVEMIPLRRVGKPVDVAKVVAFLCSEGASFMTGVMVDINGGFLID